MGSGEALSHSIQSHVYVPDLIDVRRAPPRGRRPQDERPRPRSCRPTRSSMSLVRFEIEGAVARITLDNPPHNVLSREVMSDLADAIDRLDARLHRAVLLTGAGQFFS